MTRSRKSQTLIEVISKEQSTRKKSPGTDVPTWFSQESDTPTTAPSATPKSMIPASPTGPSDATPTRRSVPVFRIDGPRVILTFSSFTVALALFAAGAALIAAYELGQNRGDFAGHERGFQDGQAHIRRTTADEIESARKKLPNPGVLSGLGASPVKTPVPTQNVPKTAGNAPDKSAPWVRDHTYIVVQEFLTADLADAQHARDFLAENSIETRILDASGKYGYRLVATKGFNCDDPNQKRWCDKYHERIGGLGKKFRLSGGRYDLQGYKKKAAGKSW